MSQSARATRSAFFASVAREDQMAVAVYETGNHASTGRVDAAVCRRPRRFDGGDLEFVAARGTVIGDKPTGDANRGLLGQLDRGLPDRFVDLWAEDDALEIAETVAQDDEAQFSLLAPVIDPALDGDFLVHERGKIGDGDHGRRHRFLLSGAELYTRALQRAPPGPPLPDRAPLAATDVRCTSTAEIWFAFSQEIEWLTSNGVPLVALFGP